MKKTLASLVLAGSLAIPILNNNYNRSYAGNPPPNIGINPSVRAMFDSAAINNNKRHRSENKEGRNKLSEKELKENERYGFIAEILGWTFCVMMAGELYSSYKRYKNGIR